MNRSVLRNVLLLMGARRFVSGLAVSSLGLLFALGVVEGAAAKGARTSYFLPGERWEYQSDQRFGSVAAARRGATEEWVAYFLRRGEDVAEGTLVAPVRVWHLLPTDRWLRYRVSFRIPDVDGDMYRIVICNPGCTQMFGSHAWAKRVIVLESASERLLMNRLDRRIVGVSNDWLTRPENQRRDIERLVLEQHRTASATDALELEVSRLKRAREDNLDWWVGLAAGAPVMGILLWRRKRSS